MTRILRQIFADNNLVSGLARHESKTLMRPSDATTGHHQRVSLANIADNVLDALIVPSFTRIGPALRRRVFDWTEPDVSGRRIAVTGPTSGLGLAAARRLAAGGAEVLLLARNPTKAAKVKAELDAVAQTPTSIVELDLASLASAARAGEQLGELEHLDALVHNGGALHDERSLSDDGIELTLATHVVAPFLVTGLALPALKRADAGRIVTVTSGGMYSQRLHLDDLQIEHDYKGAVAYARAKRAQVDLTQRWAERLASTTVTVHAMHPGWADTPGVADALPGFGRLIGPLLRTPDEGADTIVWLCGTPADDLGSGQLWLDRRPRPTGYLPGTKTSDADAARLWDAIVELTGRPELFTAQPQL